MKLDKSKLYPVVLIFLMFVVYQCRKSDYDNLKKDLVVLRGETMGTYYDIRYFDPNKQNYQESIDSILISYNQLFSTYIPTSNLSVLNKKDTSDIDSLMYKMLVCSSRLYDLSEGYYDPTILPLIKRWGFAGDKYDEAPSNHEVDSLLKVIGFSKITFNQERLIKPVGLQIDLSSIAKGLAVDAISIFLDSKNIKNHKVDIGGELKCRGIKPNDEGWVIGISRPEKMSDEIIQKVEIHDWALATSGNYRNRRTYKGKEYGHTINPKTGRPEENKLLSVSVFSKSCMTADAFATACMASGLDRSIKLIEQNDDVEGYLIYLEGGEEYEYFSPVVKKMIQDE